MNTRENFDFYFDTRRIAIDDYLKKALDDIDRALPSQPSDHSPRLRETAYQLLIQIIWILNFYDPLNKDFFASELFKRLEKLTSAKEFAEPMDVTQNSSHFDKLCKLFCTTSLSRKVDGIHNDELRRALYEFLNKQCPTLLKAQLNDCLERRTLTLPVLSELKRLNLTSSFDETVLTRHINNLISAEQYFNSKQARQAVLKQLKLLPIPEASYPSVFPFLRHCMQFLKTKLAAKIFLTLPCPENQIVRELPTYLAAYFLKKKPSVWEKTNSEDYKNYKLKRMIWKNLISHDDLATRSDSKRKLGYLPLPIDQEDIASTLSSWLDLFETNDIDYATIKLLKKMPISVISQPDVLHSLIRHLNNFNLNLNLKKLNKSHFQAVCELIANKPLIFQNQPTAATVVDILKKALITTLTAIRAPDESLYYNLSENILSALKSLASLTPELHKDITTFLLDEVMNKFCLRPSVIFDMCQSLQKLSIPKTLQASYLHYLSQLFDEILQSCNPLAHQTTLIGIVNLLPAVQDALQSDTNAFQKVVTQIHESIKRYPSLAANMLCFILRWMSNTLSQSILKDIEPLVAESLLTHPEILHIDYVQKWFNQYYTLNVTPDRLDLISNYLKQPFDLLMQVESHQPIENSAWANEQAITAALIPKEVIEYILILQIYRTQAEESSKLSKTNSSMEIDAYPSELNQFGMFSSSVPNPNEPSHAMGIDPLSSLPTKRT